MTRYHFAMVAAVLLFGLLALAATEIAARWIGLGTPVLYYTAAWGGLRPLPDQQVQRIGVSVTVDHNGFRTARPEESNALRVLFIGDSVTWGGSYVDDTAIFSEVSADVLRAQGISVYAMNAAVNGTSLANQMEILRGNVQPIDVLVWLFPPADLTRAYQSGGDVYPARFRPRFALVEAIDLLIFRYWRKMLRHDISEIRDREIPSQYDPFFDREIMMRKNKNTQALRCVLEWTTRNDVPVIIGVTPYFDNHRLVDSPVEITQFLRESVQTPAVLFDVHNAFNGWEDGLSDMFVDVAHFSAAGHKVVGDALGQKLLDLLKERKPVSAFTKKVGGGTAHGAAFGCI